MPTGNSLDVKRLACSFGFGTTGLLLCCQTTEDQTEPTKVLTKRRPLVCLAIPAFYRTAGLSNRLFNFPLNHISLALSSIAYQTELLVTV
jgi:hypothetical protein